MQDLEGIAHCCPRLRSLNISSCRSLHPLALSILLPALHQQQCDHTEQGFDSSCALPQLASLDVSYCSLPAGMVCRLLQHGYRFQVSCDLHFMLVASGGDYHLSLHDALTSNECKILIKQVSKWAELWAVSMFGPAVPEVAMQPHAMQACPMYTSSTGSWPPGHQILIDSFIHSFTGNHDCTPVMSFYHHVGSDSQCTPQIVDLPDLLSTREQQ